MVEAAFIGINTWSEFKAESLAHAECRINVIIVLDV
jgi:hypothetical protein